MSRMNWDRARAGDFTADRYSAAALARYLGCSPKPPTPKQQSYMRVLANRYETTFSTTDICCSKHASQWIDETKRKGKTSIGP